MSTQSTAKGGWLDKTFRLSEKHTTVKREFLAGLTTFLTMVYIVAVNPSILGDAGMDKNAQFYATAISSAIACIAIAFYGNFPFALARPSRTPTEPKRSTKKKLMTTNTTCIISAMFPTNRPL